MFRRSLCVWDRREGEYLVGRTQYDSPEVDPEVLIPISEAAEMQIGEFYDVKILSANDFDLYARPLAEDETETINV